jgi:RNA recognition motif-containing protein
MKKLFVGNLPFSATEDDLRTLFDGFGSVASLQIVMDRETGRSRGFAFVEINDDAEADEAIRRVNGRELKGRALNVNEARPQREGGGGGGFRSRGPGGGGGGYRRDR